MNPSPHSLGFRQPAEWSRHASCWTAWPVAADLWLENLDPAQAAVAQMIRSIAISEPVNILVPNEKEERRARDTLGNITARFHRIPVGDIWLRDTAPIFVTNDQKEVAAVRFGFNGWGGKYVLDHDADVSQAVALASKRRTFTAEWVLEGGSVDVDGEGTCLTTRQCLLNPNRNPKMGEKEIEAALLESIGATKVLWLGDGLINDHTDGHVDTVARFVAPGVVVCMEARSEGDPNAEILRTMKRDLEKMTDAKGRKLEVIAIPSPGRVEGEDGRVMPASFVNFYIANGTIVVPTYGTKYDDEAVMRISKIYPDRTTFGIDARAVLSGGGAFHCITQQEPSGGA